MAVRSSKASSTGTQEQHEKLPPPSELDIKPGPDSSIVKSARRVFEILEIFERIQRPARVSEIVEITDYPQSSVSMLLSSLEKLGYLNWDPDHRTYVPSLRVNMLGGWVHDALLPHSLLRTAMRELSERTGLTVVLGQPNGRFVRYAHVVVARNSHRSYVHLGMERPLIGSALGYALLSGLDDAQIGRIAHATLAAEEKLRGARSTAQVLATVEKVRRLGYAFSTRHPTPGEASFSFLLPLRHSAGAHTDANNVFGLALAGQRQYCEQNLKKTIATVNEVVASYLPDIQVNLDEEQIVEKI